MEVNSERLTSIKNILQFYNKQNEFAKFKICGIEKEIIEDLLVKQYGYRVMSRCGNTPEVKKQDIDYCVRWMTDSTFKPSIMLYGGTGTGKTTFMTTMFDIYNAVYRNEPIYSFRFCKASELGSVMKNEKDEFQKLKTSTVLFIDDLGFSGESEMVNDYGVKRKPIEEILEYRYDKMRATCCTTNLGVDELRDRYGEKIFSRMMEQFAFVPIVGKDHRFDKSR